MTRNMKLPCIFILLFVVEFIQAKPSKCNFEAKEIPFLPLRKANFPLARNEQPICDINIIPESGSWYKITEDIVTNATDPYRCGTENGIWMKGNIPEKNDGIVNRTACAPGVSKDCELVYNIMVENCGDYRMYFLPPPSRCNEAYCFGYGKLGHVPSNITEKPIVKYGFIKEISRVTHEVFYFDCSFQILNDDSFFYQIFWFANGQIERVMRPMQKESLSQSRWTLQSDLPKFNVNISCAVSITYGTEQKAGPMSQRSDDFFAGVKVSKESVIMTRGKQEQIALTLTLPMACNFRESQDKYPENCKLDFEVYIPLLDTCAAKINSRGKCVVSIHKKDWNKPNALIIRHGDNGLYELHHDYKIYLRTVPLAGEKMWHNITLSPIKVTVQEAPNDWKEKSCFAHSDPHMKTFDGISYDNQNSGTFIMYRSHDDSGNIMEVQTKVTECNSHRDNIFCNCAIAVRAAGDVYVINRCPKTTKYFDFKSCHNNILEIKKFDEFHYTFKFPTGTKVTVNLQTYEGVEVMDIEIFPSLYDVRATEGLCSKLGTNGNLYARDKSVIRWEFKPDTFSNSWKVQSNEDLIKPTTLSLTGLKTTVIFCTCESNAASLSNISICKESKREECSIRPEKDIKTLCKLRSKRSAHQRFSFVPKITPTTHLITRRSAVHTSNVHMNKSQAEDFCRKYMGKSAGFEACSKIPGIQPQNAIDNCILDIQLTNSTSWATASREGLKSLCFKELQQNNTLQNETKKEDGKSIVNEILSVTCPGECNNHGQCNNGTCKCDDDYTAADCSMNKNDPPILDGVNTVDGGLCDIQHCLDAFVEGDLFLDTPNLTCRMHRFEIPYKGPIAYKEVDDVRGEHNTLSNVRCPFPPSRKRRSPVGNSNSFVTGYRISVSNNGKIFSLSHLLYILDSTCQDTMNVSGELRFVLRDGFCFVNGRCIADNTQDEANKCNVCKYKSDAFAWTKQSLYEECKEEAKKLWIIGVVLGCIVVLVAVTVAILMIKKKNKRMTSVKPPPYE